MCEWKESNMNGFDPVRRKIIDYNHEGYCEEIYNGLLDECPDYKLVEAAKSLREKFRAYRNSCSGFCEIHLCDMYDSSNRCCVYETWVRALEVE